jgi:uncharacterized protein (TIGR03032 family)
MTVSGNSLWVSSLYQIWRFENVVPQGEVHDSYDRIFVPKVSYVTGDCDVHDLGIDADGNLVFVNTLFGCLATVSETHSFKPVWQPPFISQLAAEDRCHLNGMAMVEGRPKYVTAVSQSDVADGWRDRRQDGGVVIDVDSNEIVISGLSMPHSPRFYNGKLWLLDSGSGYFGHADLETGKFERVAFCPGYLRDLRSGDVVHWLRVEGIIEELYDVVILPEVRRATAIGFVTDEIRRVISVAPEDG